MASSYTLVDQSSLPLAAWWLWRRFASPIIASTPKPTQRSRQCARRVLLDQLLRASVQWTSALPARQNPMTPSGWWAARSGAILTTTALAARTLMRLRLWAVPLPQMHFGSTLAASILCGSPILDTSETLMGLARSLAQILTASLRAPISLWEPVTLCAGPTTSGPTVCSAANGRPATARTRLQTPTGSTGNQLVLPSVPRGSVKTTASAPAVPLHRRNPPGAQDAPTLATLGTLAPTVSLVPSTGPPRSSQRRGGRRLNGLMGTRTALGVVKPGTREQRAHSTLAAAPTR
mmetsp:Transcript_31416/g.72240  ORF Transcript_31416/g.72240 Transcript_31416/m.72240 type:complete len:291 (+) Transcript_31416:1352-2224(+)